MPDTIREMIDQRLTDFFESDHHAPYASGGQTYKISDFYNQKKKELEQARQDLKRLLLNSCGANPDSVASDNDSNIIKERLDEAEELFSRHSDVLRRFNNVQTLQQQIKNFRQNGGSLNVAKFMANAEEQKSYGDPGLNTASWRGGSPEEISHLENRNSDFQLTQTPSDNLRRNAASAFRKVLHERKVSKAVLGHYLRTGDKNLPPAEIKKLEAQNNYPGVAGNIASYYAHNAVEMAKWPVRGVLPDSLNRTEAQKTPAVRKYFEKRNELLANLALKAGGRFQSSNFYLKLLEKINNDLAGSDDLMDPATFAKMQKLISDEISKEENINKQELEALNSRMREANRQMLYGWQEHVDESDRLWKYRFLQMFLLLTPIGAFSIAGHIFSYMDPVMQFLGPLFDGSTTLSEGIGSMVSSDGLGAFGKVFEAIRLDDAIEFLLDKTPIINNLLEAVNYLTDNEMAQSFFGTVGPGFSSPLILMAVFGVYSFFRADVEVQHYGKGKEFIKHQNEFLENIVEEFQKERDGEKLRQRINNFARNRANILKERNLEVELAEFMGDAANRQNLAAIFKDLQFTLKDEDENEIGQFKMQNLIANGSLDSDTDDNFKKLSATQKAFKILSDSGPAVKKEAMQQFLLFKAVCDSSKTADENLAEFDQIRDPQEASKMRQEAKAQLEQELVIKAAQTVGLISTQQAKTLAASADTTNKASECRILEDRILDRDADHLHQIARARIPHNSVLNPSATGLNDMNLKARSGNLASA
jgi:hypothetical protein